MQRLIVPLFLLLVAFGATAQEEGRSEGGGHPEPPRPAPAARPGQGCLSAAETREAVSRRTVIAPVVALRSARATVGGGQVLRARLCHTDGALVYHIAILSHDGRVVRLNVDAVSGKVAKKD